MHPCKYKRNIKCLQIKDCKQCILYIVIFQFDDAEFQSDLPSVDNPTLESILNEVQYIQNVLNMTDTE